MRKGGPGPAFVAATVNISHPPYKAREMREIEMWTWPPKRSPSEERGGPFSAEIGDLALMV